MARALVTGTSSGIGLTTAVRLATDGHDVVATMRDLSAAGELRAAAAAAGVAVRVVELDVDDDASVTRGVAEAGDVDVLVNNAGLCPLSSIEEHPVDAWRALFETNVFGAVRCSQAVLPGMRARRAGHIVNVSTAVARATLPIFGVYAASKAALETMSEALAMEVGPFGIGVSIVQVGAVATPMQGKAAPPPSSSPYRQSALNGGLVGGFIHSTASRPDDVATAIAALVAAGPGGPLRTPVASGADALLALRQRLGDDAWRDLFTLPTAAFVSRWQELTGDEIGTRSR